MKNPARARIVRQLRTHRGSSFRGGRVVQGSRRLVARHAVHRKHGFALPARARHGRAGEGRGNHGEFSKRGKIPRVGAHVDRVARWSAPDAPGNFQLLVDGKPLAETFDTKGKAWAWQDGGMIEIAKSETSLALHDLTGFAGRYDAISFTKDAAFTPPNSNDANDPWRRTALGFPENPEDAGSYDLVVIGGGDFHGAHGLQGRARAGSRGARRQRNERGSRVSD